MKKRMIWLWLNFCLLAAMASGCGAEDADRSSVNTQEMLEQTDGTREDEAGTGQKLDSDEASDETGADAEGASDTVQGTDADGAAEEGAVEGIIVEKVYPSKEITYDADGNLTGWKEYDEEGKLTRSWATGPSDVMDGGTYESEREYNALGFLTQLRYIDYYPNGELQAETVDINKYEEEYDEAGNVIKVTYIQQAQSTYHAYDDTFHEWNDGTTYNDTPTRVYEYEYDAAGHMVKRTEYSGNNGGFMSEEEYNQAGYLIREYSKSIFGNKEYTYEYDNAGNVINKSYAMADDLITQTIYEYDDYGSLVKISTFDASGENTRTEEYQPEYDDSHRLIKSTKYDQEGEILSWTEYEYR